ncbi:MAG: type II secretion system protein [Planctomycetota bacterium]
MTGTPTSSSAGTGRGCPAPATRRGFSLIELLVVLAVALMLTGLLLPAMSGVRENARRIICSSNLRQQGMGTSLWARDHNDNLPPGAPLHWEDQAPQELMAAHQGGRHHVEWDGLGLLFAEHYCGSAEIFYCPSHHGEHTLDKYAEHWSATARPREPVYTNYHYGGDVEWNDPQKRRKITDANILVLATDGLRTALDYNHQTGMNVLFGDGSVRWEDDQGSIIHLLPGGPITDPDLLIEYARLWSLIEPQGR